jgi:hypothetical protein
MALPLPTPKGLLGDNGYDGDWLRENLPMRGILPIIPPRSNRKMPEPPDYRRYKDRNRVGRSSLNSSSNAASPHVMTKPSSRVRAPSASRKQDYGQRHLLTPPKLKLSRGRYTRAMASCRSMIADIIEQVLAKVSGNSTSTQPDTA